MTQNNDVKLPERVWVNIHDEVGASAGVSIKIQTVGTVDTLFVNSSTEPTSFSGGAYTEIPNFFLAT